MSDRLSHVKIRKINETSVIFWSTLICPQTSSNCVANHVNWRENIVSVNPVSQKQICEAQAFCFILDLLSAIIIKCT